MLATTTLLLAACGGSDSDPTDTGAASGSSGDSSDGSSAPASDDGGPAEAAPEDPDDSTVDVEELAEHFLDSAGETATVSLGGETWEFGLFDQIPMATCNANFWGGSWRF